MMGALSPGLKGRLWGASAAALLSLSFGLATAIGPAEADKVGVAAAVNPDAFSSLAGSPQSQLNIGKSIFFNERINTTTNGLVQVLLVDGSTFTVGPGSDLVIDKFVYDPKKGTGQIAASMTKGVMRFVGGKISKNEDSVKVDTPAGALAIRGGMFQMQVTGPKIVASFLHGVAMTLVRSSAWSSPSGNKYTVYEPGYTIDTTNGTPTVRPTTSADINAIMAALTNGNTGGTGSGGADEGAGGPKPGSKYTQVETLSLQDLISDATATQINDTIQQEETQEPANNPPPCTGDECNPPPEPTQVTVRVLNTAGVYTATFPNDPNSPTYTTDDAGKQGILGGGDYADGTPLDKHGDDFIWTFDIVNGRLTGTVPGLFDSHCTIQDCSEIETTQPPDAVVDFPGTLDCVDGICAITPEDHATVTQDGKTTTFVGLAVLKPDFYAYHVIGVPDENSDPETGPSTDPLLIFGGKGYDFGTPSGKTYAFLLMPDVKEGMNGAIAPFAGGGSFPVIDLSTDAEGNYIKPLPVISDLLYLEKDGGTNDQSQAVWLQTSLYINTTPGNGDIDFDQQSFVNIALGGVENGGLVGARRGGASVDFVYENCEGPCQTKREAFAFTGDIATLAGPDGSHFLGKDDPNIVIGFDSTGTHNIGRDIPLNPNSSFVENQSGSTYHIGVGLGALEEQPQQTLNGEFKGYAVGMVQSEIPASNFINVVASTSPDDFNINFNKTTNTLSANLTVRDVQNHDGATDAYILGFGDDPKSPANKSAYIDNLHYAAIENGTSAVSGTSYPEQDLEDESLNDNQPPQTFTYHQSTATAYLVSGDQLNVTSFFPETFDETSPGSGVRPFCTNCEFMQWGAWGARVAFGNNPTEDSQNPSHFADNVHLGWWVAGDLASATDLDTLDALGATATYNGHAIGNVANLSNDVWKTYVAAGDLKMIWNFGPRTGNLTIDKFDTANFSNGLSFKGDMSAPGALAGNNFGGSLSGSLPSNLSSLSGSAAGSFVNDGDKKAVGVIGNWNVGNGAYKATGIFAGSGTP